jgi:hypothetical protein
MELLGIPAATLVQGGLGSFGILAILLILTGRLIPIRTHEREMAREQQRGDDWHAAWQATEQRADEQQGQLAEILMAVRQRPPAGRSR